MELIIIILYYSWPVILLLLFLIFYNTEEKIEIKCPKCSKLSGYYTKVETQDFLYEHSTKSGEPDLRYSKNNNTTAFCYVTFLCQNKNCNSYEYEIIADYKKRFKNPDEYETWFYRVKNGCSKHKNNPVVPKDTIIDSDIKKSENKLKELDELIKDAPSKLFALMELKEKGVITQEELEAKSKELLGL